ncbi:MAG: CehA/McbA family metallohydrolase [Candidatus Promineifilaceae bacterium]
MNYQPLNLSPLLNCSVDLYETLTEVDVAQIPLGEQVFQGLPFQIGDDSADHFLGFGSKEGLYQHPVRIPIGKTAHYLIFAHALLETDLWQGGAVGEQIARYLFHYENGRMIEAPIRERFEIDSVPFRFGQKPFLCVSNQKDNKYPRSEGPFGMAGWRMTEVRWGIPRAYYLYAWSNPEPDSPLAAVEIVPAGRTFIIAGITASHLPEFPFVRQTRRSVVITLPERERAKRPFKLAVSVDRGVATYPYPLPKEPLDNDLTTAGFGAAANEQSSPAYLEIAALPSATVTVSQDGKALGAVNWGELEEVGAVETKQIRLEVTEPGKNWVHVTVVDGESGKRLPCRVAFHSPEGVPFPPYGHHAPVLSNMDSWHQDVGGDVQLGQVSYAYIDGTCQGWLPRGKVLVDVACGYEYQPLRQWVTIEPGQQQLKLHLERLADMNGDRWFSGDSHVHFLSTIGSQLEAQGEGLNVVNLLQSQWGHLFTNTEEFTGRPHISEDGRTIVYVAQENRQHMFGHLSLLGLKRPVMPWCSGGPSEAELGGGVDVTLSDWADQCHAQNGTVLIPHLGLTNGEQAALIATGRADAVEMLNQETYLHKEYYRYLNGGYRLPLSGGTDKMDSKVPVGLYRTYVYIPPDEPFTFENWCKGLRDGRTFLSGGPLLWFTVEGQPIGSTLQVQGGGTVEVEAQARSIFPLHCLQIVSQGQVVAETADSAGSTELSLKAKVKVTGDCWLAARCGGPGYFNGRSHLDGWQRGIMAHTSPIYLATAEAYRLFNLATANYMLTLVEGNLRYIREMSPQHRPDATTYPHGEADHIGYLSRPFLEAQAAIHKRLHELGADI